MSSCLPKPGFMLCLVLILVWWLSGVGKSLSILLHSYSRTIRTLELYVPEGIPDIRNKSNKWFKLLPWTHSSGAVPVTSHYTGCSLDNQTPARIRSHYSVVCSRNNRYRFRYRSFSALSCTIRSIWCSSVRRRNQASIPAPRDEVRHL